MTSRSDGMFAPLTEAERAAASTIQSEDEPGPVAPVPGDAPEPDWHKLLGCSPMATWTYRTANGAIAFHVARINRSNGKKDFFPATWKDEGWVLKAMPAPRPLYNLPTILKAPAEPVVVVEGEKCADAAMPAFLDQAVTTWPGGACQWDQADWTPLAGRDVLLVADADKPGREAMRNIASRLASMGCTVRILLSTDSDSSDIADAIERDGPNPTRELIEAEAKLWEPEASATPDTEGSATWQAALIGRMASGDLDAIAEPETVAWMRALKERDELNTQLFRAKLMEIPKVRAGLVDAAFGNSHRSDDRNDLQGRAVEWPEVEPWPEPVDGAKLLDSVAALIPLYVAMSEPQSRTCARWVVHTWLHDRLEISTFLNITSATKRCGKSLLMEVLGALVWRPLPVSGRVTPAALFRTVEMFWPTFMLDEVDTYVHDDPELRGLINGSQRKDSAFVIRTVGEDHEPRRFGTWCPKAIAGIGGLPDTVLDRSVVIRLERRPPEAFGISHWRNRDRDAIKELNCKIARWVRDNAGAVLARRNAVVFPPGLNDRARDAWEALLAIGDVADGQWMAAPNSPSWREIETVFPDSNVVTGTREVLLADLWQVFQDAGEPAHLPTGKPDECRDPSAPAILSSLCVMEERPWSEYRRGRPLTPRGLADLLKPFGVVPGTIRLESGSTPKGYKRASLAPIGPC